MEGDFQIMELKKNQNINGNLNISAKALEIIIKKNISEIEGVWDLAPLPFNLKQFVLKRGGIGQVGFEVDSGTVALTCAVVLKPDYPIQKVCEKIQDQIKNVVQNMTGLIVSSVNVYVVDLCID